MQLVTSHGDTHIRRAYGKAPSPPLSPQIADALLHLLGSDNEFRRLFKKDPTAALAKVGYAPAQQMLASRTHQKPGAPAQEFFKVRRLAPKAEIIASRAILKDYFESPFTFKRCADCFEPGNVAPTLRRR